MSIRKKVKDNLKKNMLFELVEIKEKI